MIMQTWSTISLVHRKAYKEWDDMNFAQYLFKMQDELVVKSKEKNVLQEFDVIFTVPKCRCHTTCPFISNTKIFPTSYAIIVGLFDVTINDNEMHLSFLV